MARWPELEIGKNSATPWMIPRRMEDKSVMIRLLPFHKLIQNNYSTGKFKIPP
jgi:hypothetical protein